MRALGYRTVDMLVARLTDPTIPPLRRATPAEMRARLSGPPPQEGQDFEAIIERLERDVLPFMSRGDHPGLLRVHPVLRHVAGRARRLRGERLQRLRRLVDGVRRPDAARARGAELVQGVDRLSGRRRRDPRRRRLGGEPHRAGLRARVARRRDVRRRRRLRLRPGALLARPRRARARLSPRADPRAAPRRRLPPRSAHGRGRDGRRPARRPPAAVRRGHRRHDEHRLDRPARRARRRSVRSAASGCTSTPPTAASRR